MYKLFKYIPAIFTRQRRKVLIAYTLLTLPQYVIYSYVYYRVGKQYLYANIQQLLSMSFIAVYSTIHLSQTKKQITCVFTYFLFAAIHHLKSSPTFSVRPCSSVGRMTVDLFRRSWVLFPPRSKDFFFASCGSLFPLTRANALWVIHGLSST